MAQASTKEEPLLSLTSEQRQAITDARKLKGWKQKDLAKKAKTSIATISNVEGGRSVQVTQSVYAKILRALRLQLPDEPPEASDAELVVQVIDLVGTLGREDLVMVRNLALGLSKKSTKPA